MENNKPDQEKPGENTSLEVVKSFLTQFSNNQNHHQTLFIQFLSSVVIVLIGYAFVFSNTSGYTSSHARKEAEKDSISAFKADSLINVSGLDSATKAFKHDSIMQTLKIDSAKNDTAFVLQPLQARPFESTKNKNGNILSYGLIHLVIIYLFSQMVLIILGLLILHMGYSYRRDQVVVNKMRRDFLAGEKYDNYFSTYSGLNKKLHNYLPNFNSILFGGIFLIQFLIYLSIYIFFNQFDPKKYFLIDFTFLNANINYLQAKAFLAIPLAVSIFFYVRYFAKYNKKINNLDHYRHISIIKVTNRKTLHLIALISLLLFIIELVIWLNNRSFSILAAGILGLANAIACYMSAYIQLRSAKSAKANYGFVFKITIHGFIFLIASVLIFLSLFFPVSPKPMSFLNHTTVLVIISSMIILIMIASYLIKRNFILKDIKNEFKIIVRKQLDIEGYFLGLIISILVLGDFMSTVFWDKTLAAFIGILAMVWGIRRLATGQDIAINRKKKDKPIE